MSRPIRESLVEKHLVTLCKAAGCLTYKFTSPGHAGVPDRLVITPTGETVYVELKQAGKKPTLLQNYHIKRLRERGCRVFVAAGKAECETVMADICES